LKIWIYDYTILRQSYQATLKTPKTRIVYGDQKTESGGKGERREGLLATVEETFFRKRQETKID